MSAFQPVYMCKWREFIGVCIAHIYCISLEIRALWLIFGGDCLLEKSYHLLISFRHQLSQVSYFIHQASH